MSAGKEFHQLVALCWKNSCVKGAVLVSGSQTVSEEEVEFLLKKGNNTGGKRKS